MGNKISFPVSEDHVPDPLVTSITTIQDGWETMSTGPESSDEATMTLKQKIKAVQKLKRLVVLVGPGKGLFAIPIDELSGACPLFQETSQLERFQRQVELPDTSVETFKLYLAFYRQNMQAKELAGNRAWRALVKAYILSEKIDDHFFESTVKEALRLKADAAAKGSEACGYDDIIYAYGNTQVESRLRIAIVNLVLDFHPLAEELLLFGHPPAFRADLKKETSIRDAVDDAVGVRSSVFIPAAPNGIDLVDQAVGTMVTGTNPPDKQIIRVRGKRQFSRWPVKEYESNRRSHALASVPEPSQRPNQTPEDDTKLVRNPTDVPIAANPQPTSAPATPHRSANISEDGAEPSSDKFHSFVSLESRKSTPTEQPQRKASITGRTGRSSGRNSAPRTTSGRAAIERVYFTPTNTRLRLSPRPSYSGIPRPGYPELLFVGSPVQHRTHAADSRVHPLREPRLPPSVEELMADPSRNFKGIGSSS